MELLASNPTSEAPVAPPGRSRRAPIFDWLSGRLARETSSGRFIPEMDGLRFAAIGMVVLFHLNGYMSVKSTFAGTSQLSSDWLAHIALVGFRGVELFFVISGFILGLPFAAHYLNGGPRVNLSKYYLRRLTRLEPPYFAAVLLLFVLAVTIQGNTVWALSPHLWASLFYLHNLIYGSASSVMGVAWSLEIEVQFYLLVPLLTLLFAIRDSKLRRVSLGMIIFAILAAQALFLHDCPRVSLSILAFLQFFLIGFLLADIFLVEWRQLPQRAWAWDAVAFAGWPVLFLILRSSVLTHWVFPFWILILYAAAFRGVIINRFFSSPWITAIGGMCYSIYLLHYEVISAVGRWTRRFAQGVPYWMYLLIQLAMVGAAILMLCGIYFVAIEKPCMRRDWPRRLWIYSQKAVFTKRRSLGNAGTD
jgi:peptidoglycan/LPS O-acetylase OafA/YrhL